MGQPAGALVVDDFGVEADVALNLNLDTGVIAIVIGVSATLIVIFLIGTYLCARGCLKKPQKPVLSDKRKIPTHHYDTYPGPFIEPRFPKVEEYVNSLPR